MVWLLVSSASVHLHIPHIEFTNRSTGYFLSEWLGSVWSSISCSSINNTTISPGALLLCIVSQYWSTFLPRMLPSVIRTHIVGIKSSRPYLEEYFDIFKEPLNLPGNLVRTLFSKALSKSTQPLCNKKGQPCLEILHWELSILWIKDKIYCILENQSAGSPDDRIISLQVMLSAVHILDYRQSKQRLLPWGWTLSDEYPAETVIWCMRCWSQ